MFLLSSGICQVTKASKATALAAQKEPQKPQSGFSMTAALKELATTSCSWSFGVRSTCGLYPTQDRVNRPRKHAEEIAAGRRFHYVAFQTLFCIAL